MMYLKINKIHYAKKKHINISVDRGNMWHNLDSYSSKQSVWNLFIFILNKSALAFGQGLGFNFCLFLFT
jgi:hypothetical protein